MEREARMETAKKKIRTCPACGEKIEFTKLILYTMHAEECTYHAWYESAK